MLLNFTTEVKEEPVTKKQIIKYVSECVKGHIEVTETPKQFTIYITNNDYCCKVFYSYSLLKNDTLPHTIYGKLNNFLIAYKDWISEKLFY